MIKKRTQLLFALCSLATCLVAEINTKPFVIPELKEWEGGKGLFVINSKTSLHADKADKEISRVATTFADDYDKMLGQELSLKNKQSEKNQLTFQLTDNPVLGNEGYEINIGENVSISATTPTGLYWATRTILQIAEQGDGTLPQGIITDFPDYPMRGFMLDCGRKYIPMDFLEDYVEILSYYKMNTFQIHLNDNGIERYNNNGWKESYSAFRLESTTFPRLTAEDGHYTKKEFMDFQLMAAENCVTIIPEIDIPAHSLAFTHYKPELASAYGENYLDLFKDETYEFVDALLAEYIDGENPVFIGEKVHIGTDEYKVAITEERVREKFRYFADRYIKYVESFGKKACLWGSLNAMFGETKVKSDNVLMSIWHNPYGHPLDAIKDGFDIVNLPESNYIVPLAPYYSDYLNTEKIYNTWTPLNMADVTLEEDTEELQGGMFALWNDLVGSGISVKDIHNRTYVALQTISAKTWSSKNSTVSYENFEKLRHNLSEAPGVNQAGRIGKKNSLVYELEELKPNSTTPFEEIGYGYTVEFDIETADEEMGTVLFESDHATFYLSDPVSGMLGFARDGYLYRFKSSLYNKNGARIKIQGNQLMTRLYVNNELVEELDIDVRHFAKPDTKMKIISTLVFPLRRTGNFESTITNLKVYNYIN